MIRHIKFPSIEQFRTAVQNVQRAASFMGLDEAGEAIYSRAPDYPVIQAQATEKIHGTNAGVCFNEEDGFWVQSKEEIIGVDGKDNAACAFHALNIKDRWIEIIRKLAQEHGVDLTEKIVTVYFEWCGAGIQKNTAVDGLGKRAMIFAHFKVSPKDPDPSDASVWFPTTIGGVPVDNQAVEIYNILNFPTYTFEIDFAPHKALLSQNEMVELVAKIEANSPVGQQFGKDGNIGEGIVVSFLYKNTLILFKVKGDQHSNKQTLKGLKVDGPTEVRIINFLTQQKSKAFTFEFSTDP